MIQTLMLLTAIFLLLYTTEKRRFFFNAVVLGQLGLYISRAIIIQYLYCYQIIRELSWRWDSSLYLGEFSSIMFILSIVHDDLVCICDIYDYMKFGINFFFYAFLIFGYTMFVYKSIMSFAIVYHFTSIRYGPEIRLIGDKVPRFQLVVQGTEKVLEAYTMKYFMVEVYQISTQTIIMEDQSMNTEKKYGIFKGMMDKHAQGIDSKTAFSRLLNMYKWAHKYVFFSYHIIHWVNTKNVCVINFKLSSI